MMQALLHHRIQLGCTELHLPRIQLYTDRNMLVNFTDITRTAATLKLCNKIVFQDPSVSVSNKMYSTLARSIIESTSQKAELIHPRAIDESPGFILVISGACHRLPALVSRTYIQPPSLHIIDLQSAELM